MFKIKNFKINFNNITKLFNPHNIKVSSLALVSKSQHFSESNKEDLNRIKSSLQEERKGMMQKLSEYLNFNKVSIVNHTNKDLNIKEMEKEINNYKSLDNEMQANIKKEDLKTLDILFKFHSNMISNSKFNEDNLENLLDKIKELKSVESLFNDKRYGMFKEDLLFIMNSSNSPKMISKLLNFSFLFLKQDKYFQGGSFKEFSEKMGDRVIYIIEETEMEELLIFCNFFNSAKDVDSISMTKLAEPFRNEVYRRLGKEYYLKTRMKNPYIENDEIVKILLVFQNADLLDDWIISQIFSYIHDNLDTFGIKDLVEVSLFFAEKKEYSKLFLPYFDKINDRKLKRNLKVMSVELLYDYMYLYHKLGSFLVKGSYEISSTLEKILENLLKNDSINTELNNYMIFIKSSTKLITKFAIFIENIYSEIKDKNKNLDEKMTKFLSLISEYFVMNLKFFSVDDTITMINMLSSKKLIDQDVLKQMTSNFISSLNKMDDSSFIKLINFYIVNSNLEIGPRFIKELNKILSETSNIKITIEILFLFVRRRNDEMITESNLITLQNKYNTIKSLTLEDKFNSILTSKDLICLIWCLSYFSINKNITTMDDKFLENVVRALKNQLEAKKINNTKENSIYELTLFIHSCRNYNSDISVNSKNNDFQECLNEVLILIETDIIENLKSFTLIEFLSVFNVYSTRRIGSDELIVAFFDIILKSIDQFGLIHLDVLISGLDSIKSYKKTSKQDNEDKEKLDENFLLGILNRLKIKLELKTLENSVETISHDLIKESIREFIKKQNSSENSKTQVFKKLI